MALNLSRNTRLFVSTVSSGAGTFTASNTWLIPVMDGYSIDQPTSAQNITINEAGDTPTRGQRIFNQSVDPSNVSFSTYMRPYIHGGGTVSGTDDTDDRHRAVEEILWEALVGQGPINTNVAIGATNADPLVIDFLESDKPTLMELFLYFVYENTCYRVDSVQLNSASIDFNIDEIAMIAWSGQGTAVEEDTTAFGKLGAGGTAVAGTDYFSAFEEVPQPDFIRTRLTVITLINGNGSADPADGTEYHVPITGGNLTITNNITYLTPAELGKVNRPIAGFTGSRTISGNLTAYFATGTTAGKSNTAALFADMLTPEALKFATNQYDLTITVGGATGPRVVLDMPYAHLTIPTISTEDVISTDIAFTALGQGDFVDKDELSISYYGSTILLES